MEVQKIGKKKLTINKHYKVKNRNESLVYQCINKVIHCELDNDNREWLLQSIKYIRKMKIGISDISNAVFLLLDNCDVSQKNKKSIVLFTIPLPF